MENNLYLHLLIKILDLDSSDIKKIIDSKISIHELIFSDKEYLRKHLKLKESTISKLEALKTLISEISFEELELFFLTQQALYAHIITRAETQTHQHKIELLPSN